MPKKGSSKPEQTEEKKPSTTLTRRAFLAGSVTATGACLAGGCSGKVPVSAGGTAQGTKGGGSILLTNLRLLDVEAGTCKPVAGILLRGGKVAEIYHEQIPFTITNIAKVDLNGDVVSPGLIDNHVHTTMSHIYEMGPLVWNMTSQLDKTMSCFVEHGVTTVRDVGGASELIKKWIGDIEAGRKVGPRVIRANAFVQTPGGYPPQMTPTRWPMTVLLGDLMIEATTPAEGREAVKRLHDDGAKVIKLALDSLPFMVDKTPIPVMDDKVIEAIRSEASRRGMTVAAHHTHLTAGQLGGRHQVDTLEHLAVDGVYPDQDLRLYEEAGVACVPTLSVGINLTFEMHGHPSSDDADVKKIIDYKADLFHRYGDRFLVPAAVESTAGMLDLYLSKKEFSSKLTAGGAFDGQVFINAIENGYAAKNIALLRQAGVMLGVGTDSGTPFSYPGNIVQELELLVRFGKLSTAETVKAATIDNARLLGLENQIGSIQKGKIADLVVLAENPLDDIKAYRKIHSVFQAGVQTVKRDEASWIEIGT